MNDSVRFFMPKNERGEPMGNNNKRYYYLKLKENFYLMDTIVILEDMPDGIIYSNILMKMYLMSLKYEGILMVTDELPHTAHTIATVTRQQIGTVERAIKVFIQMGFVEVLTTGAYYMTDIQSHIGQSSTEGDRKRKQRSAFTSKKLLPSTENTEGGQNADKCPPILEFRDKSLDIRDKSIESESIEETHPPFLGKYQNISLSESELEQLKTELPSLYQKYIEKLSEYMASTGKTYNSHIATIRKWAKEDSEKNAKTNKAPRNYDYDGDKSL